ncbi:hypothetical protein [Microbispora catharanthi]|uniref:Uncharacterized protein n=1 Tax=Microbispora catharanthi TaxID=1712871 RepID=A0A5N6BZP1_9ACTN|nr:hypothetical protein [Microbispora catharanthi]KAB8186006.1 hypothetical protein FH610_009650 [Microbispora catharanthi]
MIHITMGACRPCPPGDPLNRSTYGFAPEMTPQEIYEANRGYYAIGSEAEKRERYAIFSGIGVDGERVVVLAVDIDKIVPVQVPGKASRKAIEGRILEAGHPVYDTYVGKPIEGARNPVVYLESSFDLGRCKCGCGEVSRSSFVPGHDQRALHERIAQIGTVADFIDWFDRTLNSGGETIGQHVDLRHGQPQASRNDQWDHDKYDWPNGLGLFLYDDGRIKVELKDGTVAVTDVSNYASGNSRRSAHVIAQFARA